MADAGAIASTVTDDGNGWTHATKGVRPSDMSRPLVLGVNSTGHRGEAFACVTRAPLGSMMSLAPMTSNSAEEMHVEISGETSGIETIAVGSKIRDHQTPSEA